MKNFVKAFTIAEIVITMTILVGIAMILIPVLVGDTEEQVTKASLSKTYTQMQQASQSYSLLATRGKIGYEDPTTSFFKTAKMVMKTVPTGKFNDYLDNYVPNLVNTNPFVPDQEANTVVLKNGVFIIVDGNDLAVDINGSRSPNRVGKDIFYFDVTYNNGALNITPNRNGCANNCDIAPAACMGCGATILAE